MSALIAQSKNKYSIVLRLVVSLSCLLLVVGFDTYVRVGIVQLLR